MGKVFVDKKAKLTHKTRRFIPTYTLMVLTFALCLFATCASIGATQPETANADATTTIVISYENGKSPTLKADEKVTLNMSGSGEVDETLTATLYNNAETPGDGGYVFSNGINSYPMQAIVTAATYSPSATEVCSSEINLSCSNNVSQFNSVYISAGESAETTWNITNSIGSSEDVESILNTQIGTISYTYSYHIDDYSSSQYRAKITNTTGSDDTYFVGDVLKVVDAKYDFPADAVLSYQWVWYSGVNYYAIPGATSDTYEVSADYLNHSIMCAVTDSSGRYDWMISIYTGISVTQENQIDFAIYSADDSTLRFYKRGEREYNTITVGETYNGHDVSSIINDVENLYGGGTIESTFYDSNHDAIKTVVFEDKITPTTSTNKWFYYETQLSTIEKLYNLDMSNVTDASYMFGECAALTSIDGMDNWDVSNVTNMGCMFSNCASLTDLSPLANWNVASVTYMYNMFSGCKSLTNLSPLAKWNPSSVILMQDMFSYCTELTDATTGLANWDTSSVNETGYMFYNDSKLTTLDISGWNISNVRIMENMFDGCTSLKTIYVGSGSGWAGWNTSGLSNPIGMFNNCTSLVGGAGTTYDKDHIDGDYARIDDPDNGMPGYFTDIADKDKSTDTTSTALETS